MPVWFALPFGLLFVLGLTGLTFAIGGLIRLYNPPENVFEQPAAAPVFRFALTRGGAYELACTRPGTWGNGFQVPDATLRLRQLPAGPEQLVRTSNWNFMRRSDLSGATTRTIGAFTAPGPGQYELLNPSAPAFGPHDRLRVLPATGARGPLLIVAVVASGVLTIGGFVAALIAGLGGGR